MGAHDLVDQSPPASYDSEKSQSLIALGSQLEGDFKKNGDVENLSGAIRHYETARELLPTSDQLLTVATSKLASALSERFKITHAIDDIERAMKLSQEALDLDARKGQVRPDALNIHGFIHLEHNRATKDVSSLDAGMDAFYKSLHICNIVDSQNPESKQQTRSIRALALNGLGNAQKLLYKDSRGKNQDAFKQAVHFYQQAAQLYSPEEDNFAILVTLLADTYILDLNLTGSQGSLSEAIRLYRIIVSLRPPGTPDRDLPLTNLARALTYFAEELTMLNRYDEARKLLIEASRSLPEGHPRQNGISTLLATVMMGGYYSNRSVDILVQVSRESRSLLQNQKLGVPDRVATLNNLGQAQLALFESNNDLTALDEAISSYREAVEHDAQEPDQQFGRLYNNLAQALRSRYNALLNLQDLSEAISLYRKAMSVFVPNDSMHVTSSLHLSQSLLAESPLQDWDEGFKLFSTAVADTRQSARHRLKHGIEIVQAAEEVMDRASPHDSRRSKQLLDAHMQLISLLPEAANHGLTLANRFSELRNIGDVENLCRLAASRALLLDKPKLAIKILEEGKSTFWAQALLPRAFTPEQTEADPEMHELTQILIELEKNERVTSFASMDAGERFIENRRQQNVRATELMRRIRARPGMEHFLKVPDFETLAKAAGTGPVVLLVSTRLASFAVILPDPSGTIQVLRLENLALPQLQALVSKRPHTGLVNRQVSTEKAERGERLGMHKSAKGKPSVRPSEKRMDVSAYSFLQEIWDSIVWPVLDTLSLPKEIGRHRPRIHWCPFGEFTFLPLHAAGIYSGPEQICTSDYVVSSYTPSLSAILKSQQGFKAIPRQELKALLIAVPDAPYFEPLANVEDEVKILTEIIDQSGALVLNDWGSTPTVSSVIDGVQNANILHLACHGHQHDENALKSYFALQDGQLSVYALMKLDLQDAILAFLSACETATGDINRSDQAIHLTASMLFCGFRSVISTMWTMGDEDGPLVARVVYEELLEQDTFEINDIPYALDDAVQRLREDTTVGPERWATFIHVGA